MAKLTVFDVIGNDSIARNLLGVKAEPLHRFLAKLLVLDNGCWGWIGPQNSNGYPVFNTRVDDGLKSNLLCHRWAYELAIGPIPFGYHLHHKCEFKLCCNPDHLEPLPPTEHGIEQAKLHTIRTHCTFGHEYSEENIYLSKRGKRLCKICANEKRKSIYREAVPQAIATHCGNGHEFNKENTFWYTTPLGYKSRGCRECRSITRRMARVRKVRAIAEASDKAEPISEYCFNGHQYSIFGFSVSKTGQIRCNQCVRDSANRRNAIIRESQPPKEPKTECANGHSIEEFGFLSSEGRVRCRECHRIRSLEYIERRKTALAAAGVKHIQKTRKPHVFKTHCPKGHPYANPQQGSGRKHCPQCMVESLIRRGSVKPI